MADGRIASIERGGVGRRTVVEHRLRAESGSSVVADPYDLRRNATFSTEA